MEKIAKDTRKKEILSILQHIVLHIVSLVKICEKGWEWMKRMHTHTQNKFYKNLKI